MKSLIRLAALLLLPCAIYAAGASCESLARLPLYAATVTLARTVAAGQFRPPAGSPAAFRDLPAFCRVAATLKPSPDSDIKIEIWMPAAGWNGRFEAVGNGGWAGAIGYPALAAALRRKYAVAATDTGHTGASARFALGHPEKLIDFGYRAVHEMTVKAKVIVGAFYGEQPRYSYWNGCSTGGKQGLTEAQRYPADFDGIIAGAPANDMMRLHAASIWVARAVHKTPESFLPPQKLDLLHWAALEACDALDGLKDGLIEDPSRCHFDPKSLECTNGDARDCLMPAQVEAARKIYTGPIDPRNGSSIYPGFEPGSELAWRALAGPEPLSIALDTFRFVVFKNPAWDYRSLNFSTDVDLAGKIDGGIDNANDPDLAPFLKHGKLLLFHGWADGAIAPRHTIEYFERVRKTVGDDKAASMRLFLAPGMGHCRGGDGPNTFDAISAMEPWVEYHEPPQQMIASHKARGRVDRTRPLCPWPEVARYKGSGSINDAANFTCAAPAAGR